MVDSRRRVENHDPHRVPLTSMVLDILDRRACAKNADDQYVFSNHHHTCVADRAKTAAAIVYKGGVSFHFRAHDLRRTAASYMGRGRRRSLSHRACPEPSEPDAQHCDSDLQSLPLRQGDARGTREMGEVLAGILEVKPAPTTAPARRTLRHNVYEFKPQARQRAQAAVHLH